MTCRFGRYIVVPFNIQAGEAPNSDAKGGYSSNNSGGNAIGAPSRQLFNGVVAREKPANPNGPAGFDRFRSGVRGDLPIRAVRSADQGRPVDESYAAHEVRSYSRLALRPNSILTRVYLSTGIDQIIQADLERFDEFGGRGEFGVERDALLQVRDGPERHPAGAG